MSGRTWFCWLSLVLACQQQDLEKHDPVACMTNADCRAPTPRCVGAPVPDRAAIRCARCDRTSCPAGAYCSDPDGTCGYCIQDCSVAGCPLGWACQTAGTCAPIPCDGDGAPACPEHWVCDPAASDMEPASATGVNDGPDGSTPTTRGCARRPCDESHGALCADLWRCDPPNSSNPWGCVPLPCTETGRCSNDASYICTPTNDGLRSPGKDPQGCVFKNCGEGNPVCAPTQLCDNGTCRQRTCEETSCATNTSCVEMSGYASCVTNAAGAPAAAGMPGAGGSSARSSGAGDFSHGGTGSLQHGHCE